jgi:hypothetical protein
MHRAAYLFFGLSFASQTLLEADAPIRPVCVEKDGIQRIEYQSGETLIARSADTAPAGVELKLPGAEWMPVRFHAKTEREGVMELGPEKIGALTLRWRLVQKTPSLVERTLEVTADAAQQFTAAFPLDLAVDGDFASFSGPEKERVLYDTIGGGPEYADVKGQTFPIGMLRTADRMFGIVADSPGLWENRCQLLIDPKEKRLVVYPGDGRDAYDLLIQKQAAVDRYRMDGWQALAPGETRHYTTWVFGSPARSQYDAQLAAHVAVANGKGWNSSSVEAILRNTSYYLLRRNLFRQGGAEGRYIFHSGIGYGWKQWATDGFYTALGLDDAEKTIEALRSIYPGRITYEDNAQYYLIWSVLQKRAGGTTDDKLVRTAFDFIRRNERNGLFVNPHTPTAKPPGGFKTYMDVLPYPEGDTPSSNQGFHCGALMAAQELGLPVTEADIETAISAYQGLFNQKLGFMPTSRMQPDILGQDVLYGATLTYAVFGRKVLTDEQVLTHYRTSEKVKSPYGLRVISQADGALLPGHSGAYVFGGSWFLCDSANYLLAGVHSLPAAEVDAHLIKRIQLELKYNPAFNEDINTVTGKPHGHILYSWNSGFWWLRKEIRRRLGQTGPDPVGAAIDAHLGVVRENGFLRLEPSLAERSDRNGPLPSAVLKPAPELVLPAGDQKHSVDANNPAHWEGDTLHVFMSGGGIPKPLTKRATGSDLFHLGNAIESRINNDDVFHHGRWGRWIEATHKDDKSGNLYGWYHNEPGDCCPQLKRSFALTEPRIGALVSRDNGKTWTDLGFILQAPPQSVDCGTKNRFFAGGNGDFSVLLDARKEYFYFFFSSYWGETAQQGIGVARMSYADRDAPAGKVFKWHNGRWAEPGDGGRLTPVFPAKRSWHQSDPDVFWGPSIHFNTHLNRYVILMNRAQDTSWKQEGIYVTFNSDLSNPFGWTEPQKIHSSGDWYPQIIGIGKGETDKRAGRKARFFLKGRSAWEILFLAPGERE